MKKKVKGRILAILMSLVMAFTVMPMMSQTVYAATASGSCGTNLEWTYTAPNLAIKGSGTTMTDYADSYYEWPPWYDYKESITNLNFTNANGQADSSELQHIGDNAFIYLRKLSSVKLPSTLKSIGDYAFRSTDALTSITIPSSVESIGKATFVFSGIQSVIFESGSNLKTIGKEAFQGCDKLNKITIPDGVETIGDYAFGECEKLSTITIPESVTSIGDKALSYCGSLKTIYYGGTLSQWNALIDGVNLGISSEVEVICKKIYSIEFNNIVLGDHSNTKDAKTIHMAGKTWRVIGYNGRGVASNNDTATLISSDIITNTAFHPVTSWNSNHYSGSNLRTHVDGVTGSFSSAEKTAIVSRNLEGGSGNYGTGSYDSNKIAGDSVENALLWPLSVAEVNGMDKELRKAGWWLRSPGDTTGYAACVSDSGLVNDRGSYVLYVYGLRPAFNLNLESVLFTSAAAGGKSSGTVGAASLKKVSSTASSEVKLTLLDKDRKFAVARKTASGRPGDTLSFNYTNATVNDPVDAPSEYISAMIVNNEGDPVYYGRLAKPESPSGKVKVKIPSGLASGTYTLKLFSEQYNGDKKTDLASKFSDVTLNVESGPEIKVNTAGASTVYMAGIPWRVIGYDGEGIAHRNNAATLLSSEALAQGTFNAATAGNHYSGSNLQKRIDALTSSSGIFSDAEKAAILPRNLATGSYEADDPYTDGIAGNKVEGALLWPLSTTEARYTNGTLRETADTDTSSYYWWLRSPGSDNNSAAFVRSSGTIAPAGTSVNNGDYRMRPAFHLELEHVLFKSAAQDGKVSGAAGESALRQVSANTTNTYKLTLLDSSRNFDVKLHDTNGSKRTIRWSGAKTGTKEYLSAIIKDADGKLTHYGRLKNLTEDADHSGTMDINLSGINMTDKTLYVFNEEYNGDKKTDYASALIEPKKAMSTSDAATVYMAGKPWRVIGYNGEGIASGRDTATLFSSEGLAQTTFNAASDPNNNAPNNEYSGSNLQSKTDALTSSNGIFSDAEKAAIVERKLEGGSGNRGTATYNSNNVAGAAVNNAMLWPLSVAEAEEMDEQLRKTATEDISSYYWRLRSPGSDNNSAAFVRSTGVIVRAGTSVNNGDYRMRPAFNLNLNSVLFVSDANAKGGKTSVISGTKELERMGEYKLTLLDSTREFDVKLYDVDGSKRTIRWTDAETGKNEYLSVVVKDSNGAVTHYEQLKNLSEVTDAAGQMEIDLSKIDMNGKTLYVFNEQCNGAKVTDYCSALKTVGTTPQVAKHTVTYEVVNGTWSDDTNGQKSEQVYAGDKPKNVPKDMKPATGFEGGSWNINPSTVTIMENTTFTYTFVEHICDWEFTGFTWTGDETNGYTKAVAGYKCTKVDSHTTNVEAVLSDTTIEPTCTEGGKTTYTATVAASVAPDGAARTESKDAETTEATGHTFDREKAEDEYLKTGADCTHPAEYYMSCSKCGVSSQGEGNKEATFEFGEPLDHNYGEWTKLDDDQHYRECERDKTHVEKANHTWDAGKVTKPATTTATGEKTYTCTACKATKTETIAKLPNPEKQYGTDGTPVGPGASIEAAEKAITNTTSDKDIKGAKFAPLKVKSSSQGKTNIKLSWAKNKKAVKYVVYGNLCNVGSKKYKPVKIATANSSTINIKKIGSAKVKKGTYYKFVIVAIDKDNKVVSTSKTIHVATKGGKVGNHKSVTVKAKVNAKGKALKKAKPLSKTVLKKGKSLKLIVKMNPAAKKLKVKKHVGLRYETTNAKVATVSGSKIKAKGKGKCIVYAYTQNGVSKKLTVIVK